MQVIDVVYDFALISVLLFVAKIIRLKIKVIQKLYIPSVLIAGFLGLILENQVLKAFPFSEEISSYSGI